MAFTTTTPRMDPPEGGPPGQAKKNENDYEVEQALEFWKRWCMRHRQPLTVEQQMALDKRIQDLLPHPAQGMPLE